ncbi:unnamed protein product, partial [Ectocarpus sp. 8 AP-2014]
RVGVPQSEKNIFPTPMLLHTFSKEVVRQVSCGPSFCLAVTAANVWSWGAGEGCVLGHGDTLTRETPVQIEAFKGSVVLQNVGHGIVRHWSWSLPARTGDM